MLDGEAEPFGSVELMVTGEAVVQSVPTMSVRTRPFPFARKTDVLAAAASVRAD